MDDAVTFRVFTETEIPAKFTILDTLHWAAGSMFPMPYYPYDVEARQDDSFLQEHFLRWGSQLEPLWMEKDFTEKLGVFEDPRILFQRTQYEEDIVLLESESLRKSLDWQFENLSDEELSNLHAKREIDASLLSILSNYENLLASWERFLDDALDQYRADLLLKLRRGELQAEGIALQIEGTNDFGDDAHNAFDALQVANSKLQSAYSDIPREEWVSKRIDWDGCFIRNDASLFIGVRIDSKAILQTYPIGDAKPFSGRQIGDVLFIADSNPSPIKHSKRSGRPTKKWDAVHIYIAEIVKEEGGLPEKQDALAQDICDWYFKRFSEPIGLSTVKGKLASYYANSTLQKSEKS